MSKMKTKLSKPRVSKTTRAKEPKNIKPPKPSKPVRPSDRLIRTNSKTGAVGATSGY